MGPTEISHAMLGTTQVTRAIIERNELDDVAIVRLGAPATRAVKKRNRAQRSSFERRKAGHTVLSKSFVGFEHSR